MALAEVEVPEAAPEAPEGDPDPDGLADEVVEVKNAVVELPTLMV